MMTKKTAINSRRSVKLNFLNMLRSDEFQDTSSLVGVKYRKASPGCPYVSFLEQDPRYGLNSAYGQKAGGLGTIQQCPKHFKLVALVSRYGPVSWPVPGESAGDEFAFGGLAPKAIDIDHVLPDTGDGDLQKTLALGRFEKNPLLLGQPMPDASIADLAPGRLATTESLDVILVGFGHREKFKTKARKRKWR